jgi:CMP-N-acetylneuraminic acid synthetase
VIVSTDSPEVYSLAKAAGVTAPWMRPISLATDTATSVDVVLHAVEALAAEGQLFDRVALLQPTSPVRIPDRWIQAAGFLDNGAPAAVGVQAAASHPYWTYIRGVGGELTPCFAEGLSMRSQDLPFACVPNGSLYLCSVAALQKHRSLTPPGTRGVVCTQSVESIDIDTADDWHVAERLVKESRV